MGGICEMKANDVCLSWKSVLQLCVFVLSVCSLLNVKLEVTTSVENVTETFTVIRGVNTCTVQLVFLVYTHYGCISSSVRSVSYYCRYIWTRGSRYCFGRFVVGLPI